MELTIRIVLGSGRRPAADDGGGSITVTTVRRSRSIAAAADRVWAVVRAFGEVHRWVPGVPGRAGVTGDPAVPGAERTFLRDGELVVERLVVLDETRRTLAYTVVRSPDRIADHLATITVSGQGDTAVVEWEATFTAAPEVAGPIAARMASGTFEPGLRRLAELCELP